MRPVVTTTPVTFPSTLISNFLRSVLASGGVDEGWGVSVYHLKDDRERFLAKMTTECSNLESLTTDIPRHMSRDVYQQYTNPTKIFGKTKLGHNTCMQT
jgi:hypothetical protein